MFLRDVQRIVIGLPPKYPLPGIEALASPEARQFFVTAKSRSLLVVFKDGSLLPLSLHLTPNGTELMSELVRLLPNCVVEDYTYTPDEIRILRRADVNALIRK